MADLLRIRAFCLCLALWVLAVAPAHAYVHKFDYKVAGFSGVYATCEALAAALTSFFGGGSRYCQVTGSTLYVCESPSNCATVSYSQEVMTCPPGYTDTGSSCEPPASACPAAGTKSEREWSAVLPASFNGEYFYTSNELDGGTCELKVKAEICVKESATAATQTCVGSATWTGEDATGSGDGTAPGSAGTPAGSGDTAEEAMQNATGCPTGQCPGTVNGLNVCKPCNGTSTVKPKVEEKQNPDGTSEKKETTEKTTCVGKTCTTESTTTTTNKDASGTVTGTSTVTTTTQQGKGDYCKENPREPQCDDEGSWGGSCTAGFTCKGDAATCALAKEVHERNCKLDEETAASALYGTAKDATGNVTGDNPNNSTFDVGPSSFNTSDAIGGAQCIADLEVTVWGSALSLPLSDICTPLAYMGNLLVMVSLLLAARIVSRG